LRTNEPAIEACTLALAGVVAMELVVRSVIKTPIIEAQKEREVVLVDIPNAIIQTKNEKLKSHHETDIMKVKGRLVDVFEEICPQTREPDLTKESGMSVLSSILKIRKVLFEMRVSSLLFCKKLRTDFEQLGFKVNPCDVLVANKMANNLQCCGMWMIGKKSQKPTAVGMTLDLSC